jgi:hypothetical protein
LRGDEVPGTDRGEESGIGSSNVSARGVAALGLAGVGFLFGAGVVDLRALALRADEGVQSGSLSGTEVVLARLEGLCEVLARLGGLGATSSPSLGSACTVTLMRHGLWPGLGVGSMRMVFWGDLPRTDAASRVMSVLRDAGVGRGGVAGGCGSRPEKPSGSGDSGSSSWKRLRRGIANE